MKPCCKITAALLLSIVLTGELTQAKSAMLANLPTGDYYYTKPHFETSKDRYLLFRKRGFTVIGVDMQFGSQKFCFRGVVKQNSIINVTRIFPPYDPASYWEFLQGKAVDLNSYRKIERVVTDNDRAALLTCIQVFWR